MTTNVPNLVKPSIIKSVKMLIESDFSIQDALSRGYGNSSEIARILKPSIDNMMKKNIKLDSIITSVKRTKFNYNVYSDSVTQIIANSTISVKTDVIKLSLKRSSVTLNIVSKLISKYQEDFLQVSESLSALTLIFDSNILSIVRKNFSKSDILEEELNLAAIIIHSPKQIIKTPGCTILFYNQLLRRGINIEDTTSCFTDTILVVYMDKVGNAFMALTELISLYRKKLLPPNQ
tara:strand:- start:81 stop:782 length:702 start_codon:yes stop_codon:yes gene_type:complete